MSHVYLYSFIYIEIHFLPHNHFNYMYRLKIIMKQTLEALEFIHGLNLIHCDIKPENIVIKSFSKCKIKLIDFGSSCFVDDHLTTYIQSRSYRYV
jgi:serine/threonine protein kinase